GAGAADQFGLVGWVAVESHRSGLRAAGHGPVGSPARAFGGSPGELSRSPCVAFCGPCPRRSRTEKLSNKPKGFPEKGLAATEGRVNWENGRQRLQMLCDLAYTTRCSSSGIFTPNTSRSATLTQRAVLQST